MNNPSGPPPYVPTPCLTHKFRFQVGTPGVEGQQISRGDLLNLWSVATSSTSTARVIEAIRIIDCEIWGPSTSSSAGFTSAEVSVEWLGNNAPSTIHDDVSMNVKPAHVYSQPPRFSSNQWWSISGSNESEVVMQITAPEYGIVDMRFEVRLMENEAATAGPIPTGATIGTFYTNYLDGTGQKLVPFAATVLP